MKSLTLYLNGVLLPSAWLKQPDTVAAIRVSALGSLVFESKFISQRDETAQAPAASLFEQAIAQNHGLSATQVSALYNLKMNALLML